MEQEYLSEFNDKVQNKELRVTILGLGFVGFPLLIQAAKNNYHVTGFDVDKKKIELLKNNQIYINEHNNEENKGIISKSNVKFTEQVSNLKDTDLFIICVPTPVDSSHSPNLS